MPFQITKTKPELLPVDAAVEFRHAFSPFWQSVRIEILASQEAPQRVVCFIRRTKHLDQADIAACYREIFDTAIENAWHSISVPLCPCALSMQEVYSIACAEIRRVLEADDIQVFLTVKNEQNFDPAGGRLAFLREYIRKHYCGVDTGEGSALKAKAMRSAGEDAFGAGFQFSLFTEKAYPETEHVRNNRGTAGMLFLLSEDEDAEGSFFSEEAETDTPQCREENAYNSQLPFVNAEKAPVRFNPSTSTIILDESFSQAVLRKVEERGLTDPQCYSRANLSRAVFNKLKQSTLNPEKAAYKPSKSTALALAVALELEIDEAKDLLQKAGYALSHSSKGDIIVEYYLANHLYDIFELNEVLFRFGEPLLGSF